MKKGWKQDEVFPVIARIIERAYEQEQRFITAREIATGLLQDNEGHKLVTAAQEQKDDKRSPEWLAINMVSWFSQRITVGRSKWARTMERTKVQGQWAYKPASTET